MQREEEEARLVARALDAAGAGAATFGGAGAGARVGTGAARARAGAAFPLAVVARMNAPRVRLAGAQGDEAVASAGVLDVAAEVRPGRRPAPTLLLPLTVSLLYTPAPGQPSEPFGDLSLLA